MIGRLESGLVLDRDFNIAALACLRSRLLGASKRSRAASVIQRAYNQLRTRREIRRRCILLRLAYDCKTVWDARVKVIEATCVIQKSWRSWSKRKVEKTVNAVPQLQARVRGNLARQSTLSHDDGMVDIWLL